MPWLRSSAARRPLFAGYGVTSLAPGGTSFQVLSPRGPGTLRLFDALMSRCNQNQAGHAHYARH